MYNDLLLKQLAALSIAHDDDEEARVEVLIDEIEELESLVSPQAQELIRELRPHTVTEDVYEEMAEKTSLGARLADRMAAMAGSWGFILFFALIMIVWIVVNGALGNDAFDPFPFILLNLTLSTLAALQAPVILMAQNRQAEKDRAIAHNDYQVNLKSEIEIADLHRKVDELTESLLMQSKMMNALLNARRQELKATVQLLEKKPQL